MALTQQHFPDLHVKIKDEDPRRRCRTVPMKVLVLGFPRTGTSSMQRALEQLGFGPCYHMRTCMNEYPRDNVMWMDAFKAKYDDSGQFQVREWDQLLGHYSSVCDLPAMAFGPELMNAYPSAKIILTNRDVDAWHKSCSQTLLQARWYWGHEVLQYLDWMTALIHPMRKKYWRCLFADDFETNGRSAMLAHYAEVRGLAQQQGRQVLEMQMGDGWEPLCHFLDVAVPPLPYPKMNDGGDWVLKMRERARLRAKGAICRFWGAALPVVLAGLAGWVSIGTLGQYGWRVGQSWMQSLSFGMQAKVVST